ncbi:hypothetical protein H5410_036354 [Solanum commersonii]|uniref:AIG1-type G domain-containing protein n=1 Tax=Solanum commersonii TaxID=4109 RepID=A0A9J5Y535_SOLCO|nr:hypothetical protein H5410_036354 [Solanum commersonii]
MIWCISEGKSPTDNSILGRNAFQLRSSSGGVTRTYEIQRNRLEDGHTLDVIDTPEFSFNAESGLVVNEIGKCIDLADDGVHTVLFILGSLSRSNTGKITEMVESKINNTMHSLEKQLEERTAWLLTYTMWIAMRYWVGSMNKLLSHRRSTRKGNLYSSYAKLLTYTVWIATRYWARSMNKLLSHRRSTRKGNLYSSNAKLLTDNVWIAIRYWAGSMNKLLSHRRSTRKGNPYSSYAKLLKTIGKNKATQWEEEPICKSVAVMKLFLQQRNDGTCFDFRVELRQK